MYDWLKENLQKYYQMVRVLRKKEDREILLYKHMQMEEYIVVRKMQGYFPVYERLVNMKQEHLSCIYETCRNENETIIVEEYVQGITVAEILEQSTMTPSAVKQIVRQICDGLSALHAEKIIHRDIKPENIMIQKKGQVKIIDYDAAKIYKLYETKDTKTVGTIGYAAPEQYGEAQSDERTDIYALGILMNVMLTGKHPVNQMAQGELGSIIEKCIQVNPERRYRTILEVKKRLL